MTKPLFHFSADPGIAVFVPRPVRVPSARPKGMNWLNGPLVWAIDEAHSPLYLFPRDCPRIVMWQRPDSTAADAQRFLDPRARMTAYVERGWMPRIAAAVIHRYALPADDFTDLGDAGMHVARGNVTPLGCERLSDLPGALARAKVALRPVDSLLPLRGGWDTSLHVSGVRLRNAVGWADADDAQRTDRI